MALDQPVIVAVAALGGSLVGACSSVARRYRPAAAGSLGPTQNRIGRALIAESYRVERLTRERGLSGEDLRVLREQGARPVLKRLHAHLLGVREQLLPKSSRAVGELYFEELDALTCYCADPDPSIDNSHTGRSVRGWAVGRNNWTFFGGSATCSPPSRRTTPAVSLASIPQPA